MKEATVFEWLGSPRGGKSRHSDHMKRRLESAGYKVFVIRDKVREAPLLPNGMPDTVLLDEINKNHWAILEIGKILDEQKRAGWDIILVDRGFLAHYASLATIIVKIAQVKGVEVKEKEKTLANLPEIIRRIRENDSVELEIKKAIEKAENGLKIADSLMSQQDYFFFVRVSPDASLKRDSELEDRTKSEIITPEHLKLMKLIYSCIERHKLPKDKSLVINGEDDFQVNQDRIFSEIQSWLNSDNFSDARADTDVSKGEKIHGET